MIGSPIPFRAKGIVRQDIERTPESTLLITDLGGSKILKRYRSDWFPRCPRWSRRSYSKVMFAPAAQVMPCLRHSDVAPFGRRDVMCSAHVPQHTSRPKGTSLAKQTSRSATRNTSFKKASFVGRQKTLFCWRRHPDLNWGVADLQSAALPLGYGAE